MCNTWCHKFVSDSLPHWPRYAEILEVGSRNVNGSPRDVLSSKGYVPSLYIGVDLYPGEGVDIIWDVLKLEDLTLIPPNFNVVISTEMLEHVEEWCVAIEQMMYRVRESGILVLTTRSPGFEYHPWPIDRWRFTVEDMRYIFGRGWELLYIDTDPDPGQHGNAPYYGVGIVARKLPGDKAAIERCKALSTAVVHTAL